MSVSDRLALAKTLRDRTGANLLDCVKALSESMDDPDRALRWLRDRMVCR